MNDVQQMGGRGMRTVEAVVHTTNQDTKLKKKKMKTRKPSYRGHSILIACCVAGKLHTVL
jgi:hypothetical protein